MYSKFDGIVDSDDEQESREQPEPAGEPGVAEREARLQADVDRWLRTRLWVLLGPPAAVDPNAPPELEVDTIGQAARRVSDEERRTLARLMVIADHETLKDNLARHRDILGLARQNRWLEEDAGVLKLLCLVQKQFSESIKGDPDAEAQAMMGMLVCAINLLAAPERCGCAGGYGKLYRLFSVIGDPKTEAAREMKATYMKKGYAASTIFDSLAPVGSGGRPSTAELYDDLEGWSSSCLLGVLVAFLLVACLAAYHLLSAGPSARPSAASAGAAVGPGMAGAEL